jgi:WXG100 family type VII secretion target
MLENIKLRLQAWKGGQMASGSGSGQFGVTPEYISTAASACKNIAATVQDELATLQRYIENMEAHWQGIAANTFQELMAEYSTFSAMLYNALTDIGSGLNGNYVNYEATEQANINTIRAIQSALSTTNFS